MKRIKLFENFENSKFELIGDNIDEVLDASFQAMVTDNEEWSSMSSIINKHTDIIWEIVPNKRQEN